MTRGANLAPMNAAPGGELRATGGLWGPPARALREMFGRRFPKRHRPTWLSPGADQENSVLIGLLVAGWLTFRVAAPRLSPATTWGPSPANLVVANRPRGLTRDRIRQVIAGHWAGLVPQRVIEAAQADGLAEVVTLDAVRRSSLARPLSDYAAVAAEVG